MPTCFGAAAAGRTKAAQRGMSRLALCGSLGDPFARLPVTAGFECFESRPLPVVVGVEKENVGKRPMCAERPCP